MDDCCTPKNLRKPQLLNLKVTKNSGIGMRCYTPNLTDFRSPNLSPILKFPRKSPATPMVFKKPLQLVPKKISYFTTPLKPLQKNKEEQENNGINVSDESNSPHSDNDSFKDDDNTNTNHSYVFNHAHNVDDLLTHVGLEDYIDKFEEAHIDLVQLVKIEHDDLKNMGFKADDERNHIMKLLKRIEK